MDLTKLYRWCDKDGGGLVIADSKEEAREKLVKKWCARPPEDFNIWPWDADDYYDEDNPDVFDLYGW